MIPIEVPEEALNTRPDCTVVSMGPPPGVSDEECGTASMLISPVEEQMTGFRARRNYAYYRPTQYELDRLNKGGFIEFCQYGNVVQPFSASVWEGIVKEDDNAVSSD